MVWTGYGRCEAKHMSDISYVSTYIKLLLRITQKDPFIIINFVSHCMANPHLFSTDCSHTPLWLQPKLLLFGLPINLHVLAHSDKCQFLQNILQQVSFLFKQKQPWPIFQIVIYINNLVTICYSKHTSQLCFSLMELVQY